MSRYIDADEFLEDNKELADREIEHPRYQETVRELIDEAPSIDIVRCQDCKHWVYNFNGCARNPCTEPWYATDGCTYGERREP